MLSFRAALFFLVVLSSSAFAAPATKTTSASGTTTTYNPASPSVRSCKGPQRYKLQAYYSQNHTRVGHVMAVEYDVNLFGLRVAPSIPNDGQAYYDEFLQSAASADHHDFYLYIYPGGSVTPDTYLLMLYGDPSDKTTRPDVRVQQRVADGKYYSYWFHITVDHGITHFSSDYYHTNQTFSLNGVAYDGNAYGIAYDEVGRVPEGHTPIYLTPEKSC